MSPSEPPIFSASDRIRQLNKIDQDVAKLLQSAGLAVKALTRPSLTASPEDLPIQPLPIEEQRESFAATTSRYFTLISSVDVNLRRQINALEEADILPAEAFTKELPTSLAVPSAAQASLSNASLSRTGGGNKGVIIGGGLGNLDVGWLNSRNDSVGKEMKAELWGEAEDLVSKLEKRKMFAERQIDCLNDDREKEGANVTQELDR